MENLPFHKIVVPEFMVEVVVMRPKNRLEFMRKQVKSKILITNSLKYAFSDERKGAIRIQLEQEEMNLVLHISDDGVGADANKIPQSNDGFGSELIEMLTMQLKGEVVHSSKDGFQTQFRFPYKKYIIR